MLCRPFHDEAQSSSRDLAVEDRKVLDVDLDSPPLIGRVEVRRIVVRIVKSDDDTEEAA